MNIDDRINWENLAIILDEYGEYLCSTLRRKMRDNKSNASYNLSDSFTYYVTIEERSSAWRYYVIVEMEDYWKYVNEGRPPGKRPPVSKIEEWIRIKPVQVRSLSKEEGVKNLSYAIQRSIKKKKGWAPPREALVGWINKKGIEPDLTPSVTSLAWAIATKIGKYGTKGTKFYDEAVEEANRKYKDKIQDAIYDDIQEWLEKVMDGDIDLGI